MDSVISANGVKEVTVPSGQKIALFSLASAKLYKKVGHPNFPDEWVPVAITVGGTEYLSAATTAATIFRVDAGSLMTYYDVGIAPSAFNPIVTQFRKQAAQVDKADGNQSLTGAQLIGGICVHTVTTGRTLTTPTGAALAAACPTDLAVGDSFDFTLITIGAGADDISTLTPGDGNITIVGEATVGPSGSTFNNFGTFRFRYTAANTWVAYRIG